MPEANGDAEVAADVTRRRAERLGDARALVLLEDEGRRQDEDVAEARHCRRVAADDDAGVWVGVGTFGAAVGAK